MVFPEKIIGVRFVAMVFGSSLNFLVICHCYVSQIVGLSISVVSGIIIHHFQCYGQYSFKCVPIYIVTSLTQV